MANEVRYLGVHLLCAPNNSSALSTRPNGPFTEQQIVSLPKLVDWLLKQKCLPILLYALDVCNLNKRTMQSLDFTINRFL